MSSVIEEFISHTSGSRAGAVALLRESIFYMNTGKWPDHLINRNWRKFDKDGEKVTWEPYKSNVETI